MSHRGGGPPDHPPPPIPPSGCRSAHPWHTLRGLRWPLFPAAPRHSLGQENPQTRQYPFSLGLQLSGAAPPPEGKGREGQRMAICQWAPPAADENTMPWLLAKIHYCRNRDFTTRRAPTPPDASYIPDASGPDALYDTVRRVVQCLKQHSAPPPLLSNTLPPPPPPLLSNTLPPPSIKQHSAQGEGGLGSVDTVHHR